MRITGGTLRGRTIHPPSNLPIRPTTDFAKSALFNILNNYFDFETLTVLDLFAGAGSIAYEFISRETKSVTCVDEDYHCVAFIKKTASDLKINNLKCYRADAFKFVKQETLQYDIIFADPPFTLEEADKLPDLIFEKKLLKKDGWLIVEHQSKRLLQSKAIPFDVRKYGNCGFSMYKE
ncbi:MAG: RsmD family RNA methyltransferase [bacterium]